MSGEYRKVVCTKCPRTYSPEMADMLGGLCQCGATLIVPEMEAVACESYAEQHVDAQDFEGQKMAESRRSSRIGVWSRG